MAEILEEKGDDFSLILIDCLTLWISNGLMAHWTEKKFLQEADRLRKVCRKTRCSLIMVSNEVGELRYPTMIQRRDAKTKPVISYGIEDIGYEPGQGRKVELRTLYKPELKQRDCRYITGETTADMGKNLALALLQDKVIG